MFRRKRKSAEEYEWYEDESPFQEEWDVPARRSRLSAGRFLLILLLVGIVGTLGYLFLQRRTPAYAAEAWFEAVWERDSTAVMERSCNEQRWVAGLVKGGEWVQRFTDFLGLQAVPALAELGLEIDQQYLDEQFEVDRSQIQFATVQQEANRAVVRANGPLRFYVLGHWLSYRLDERWQMVREDGRWRWCGWQS